MLIPLQHAAEYMGAEILGPRGTAITGAAYDNRSVLPGELFVAIRGERSDGHDFAGSAVDAGAAAVLAEHDPFGGAGKAPVLLVDNSVKALGKLAHACRKRFAGKVVGITGTAGKTTTKELLAAILSVRGKTSRSMKNLNTQVGMPVSILRADGDEMFWVLEAGISHPEDMDELGPVMEPDIAIVLNAGTGHSLGLGGKGAAYYKSKLLRHTSPGGKALVSADYPDLAKEALSVRSDCIFFSAAGADAPYAAEYLGLGDDGMGRYRLSLNGEILEASSPLAGEYAAENIIAAAAAAHLLGLAPEEIAKGIAGAPTPDQRFSCSEAHGWTVIDDTYNANPLSMKRMIKAARGRVSKGTLVLVLGEMLELGEEAAPSHEELGRIAAEAGCRALFWYGGHADDVRRGFELAGGKGSFLPLDAHQDFLPELRNLLPAIREEEPKAVLFKGSRGNRLEKLVKIFLEAF